MLAILMFVLACGTPEAPSTEATPQANPAPSSDATAATPEAAPEATDAAATAGEWSHHGEPFTDGLAPIQVATVLDTPDDYNGKNVRVKGEIADVCQKKGCWMVIQDDKARTMRVTMKDHAFGVPMNSTGPCELEGTVIKKEPNAKEAVHFASEAGNADAIPKGEGVEATWEIVVSAVSVQAGA